MTTTSPATNGFHFDGVRPLNGSDDGVAERRSPGFRLLRTLKMLGRLQEGRVCKASKLAKLSGVSRRTIFRDIALLQEAGIDVRYDDRRRGYYINSRAKRPPRLTCLEVAALTVACHRIEPPVLQKAARQAAAKVGRLLPRRIRETMNSLAENVVCQHLDVAAELQTTIGVCLEALGARRRLRIEFDDGPQRGLVTDTVEVYRLLFANETWYVVGRSCDNCEVRAISLKRMRRAAPLEETYAIPLRFNLDRFLGNAWRIERGMDGYRVKILFDPGVAAEIAGTRWHRTQEVRRLDDGRLEWRVDVDGLDEIATWILSFGAQAEVVEPDELRTRIRNAIDAMRLKYEDSMPV